MAKPNILLITTDQQRVDSLSCYGSDFVSTPNIDRLAEEGVRCDRAYCPNPVCTPARGSLFTGQYVNRHGAWSVGVNVPESARMLGHRLREGGYRTASFGKTHFQAITPVEGTTRESLFNPELGREPEREFYGFETAEITSYHPGYNLKAGSHAHWVKQHASPEEWEASSELTARYDDKFKGDARDWGLPTRLHNSHWCAERASAYLRERAEQKDGPFFLNIGFQDPHHPHGVPRDYERRVDPAKVPLPDFDPAELESKPPHFKGCYEGRVNRFRDAEGYPFAGNDADYDYRTLPESAIREARAYYYTMVHLIDDAMGTILKTLEDTGLADNTIIVFASDHGELLGDHGIWLKGPFHVESVLRVPVLLRWPGQWRPQQTSEILSLVDIAPTLLEAAGISVESGAMDGRSFGSYFRGETDTGPRQAAMVEFHESARPELMHIRTVVTRDYKLTLYPGRDWGELYDLREDPSERVNLFEDPDYGAIRESLLRQMILEMEGATQFEPRIGYS